MARAQGAAARYRKIAQTIGRLRYMEQRRLRDAFADVRWSPELARRPAHHKAAACDSEAVRAKLGKRWCRKSAEAMLVAAEKSTDAEAIRMRRSAWAQAEATVAEAIAAYDQAKV